MPAPPSLAPPAPARFRRHVWWVLLLAALLLHGLAAHQRIERVEALTAQPPWSVDAPARDAASPTGFAYAQRTLFVPGHHNASFWWIAEAQQAVEQGAWRLRHIDYDAAPEGRDLPRTSLYRWWLIIVGSLHAGLSGESLGAAIERGALLADPFLFAVLLIGGALYTARFFGTFAAVGFVLAAASVFPLTGNFQPGAPDPRSLSWLLAFGSILPLLAPGDQTQRRRHAAAAGLFGGLGMWNDASIQGPILLAVFVAGLMHEIFHSRGTTVSPSTPSIWRIWAATGAVTTLAASVFEFAPSHFTWSLRAVHPLHACVWWGMGEVLAASGLALRQGREALPARDRALLVIAGCAIAAWPIVVYVSGSGGLLAPDFYALELANHARGGIAANLGAWLSRPGNGGAKWATLLPVLLLLVLAARIHRRWDEPSERSRLMFLAVLLLFAAGLGYHQLRWWNLFDVVVLVVLTLVFAQAEGRSPATRWRTLAVSLLVLPGVLVAFPRARDEAGFNGMTPLEAQALVARDFGYWLSRRSPGSETTLLSTPLFAGAAGYYGGFRVVVSADDTNAAGYLTAVRIASASTEQEVSVLLNSRGITHVALPLWDPVLDQLVRAGRDLAPEQPLPQDAFAVALRWWEIPLWMRPMDYLIPAEPRFADLDLRAFALQAEIPPDLGLSRLADFFVERGQLEEAKSLRESLQAYPRSVPALGAIANVDLAMGETVRLQETLQALVPYLSRRSARDLPPDRRISLAGLFVQVNRPELARDQLNAALAALDSELLRTLSPGALINLVSLSRSLRVPFPHPELEAVATELIPPSVRDDLPRP